MSTNARLSDSQWVKILAFLRTHPRTYVGQEESCRLFLEAVLWITRSGAQVDSSNRTWKIKGSSASFGSYDRPIQWTMTAVDVTAGGTNNYCEHIKA